MKTQPSAEKAPAVSSTEDAGNGGVHRFIDLMVAVAKHRVLVSRVTLAIFLAAALGIALLPNIYTARTTILPPQKNKSFATLMLGQLGPLASLAGQDLNLKDPNEIYLAMLRSEYVALALDRELDLKKRYDKETWSATKEALGKHRVITSGRDGLIVIEVDDEDPVFAARMANEHTRQLVRLSQALTADEAAQRRLFFEAQLSAAKTDLSRAEADMKQTMEKTGLIQLDGQAKAIIENVAQLRGQIAATEVRLRMLQTFGTEQNPEVQRVKEQLRAMKAQLQTLEDSQSVGDGNIQVPTRRIPAASLEYVRRFRDVKYYEAVFEFLAKQLEAAKIDEANNASVIQVLDVANPPDRKSKPPRLLLLALSLLIACLFAVTVAVAKEKYQNRLLDPEIGLKLDLLKWHVGRGDRTQ